MRFCLNAQTRLFFHGSFLGRGGLGKPVLLRSAEIDENDRLRVFLSPVDVPNKLESRRLDENGLV